MGLRVPSPKATESEHFESISVDPAKHIHAEESEDLVGWQDHYQFLSLGDIQKSMLYIEMLRELREVPGDIIELGTFRGGNLKLLALASMYVEPNGSRNIIGFDTFDGFVAEQLRTTTEKQQKLSYSFPDNLQATISKMIPLKRRVQLVKGDVVRCFHPFYETWQNRVALAYLDLDLFEPTTEALSVLGRQLSVGGRILLDQYSRDGWSETVAVDAFLASHSSSFRFNRIPNCIAPTAWIEKLDDTPSNSPVESQIAKD